MAAGSAGLRQSPPRNSGLDAELVGHLLPQRGEVAGLPHQHQVAGRQRVHQSRFPRAGARRRIDDHRLFGLENLAHAAKHLLGQRVELGSAVIDRRIIHRPQDAVRDVGRPGNLQEMPSGWDVSSGASESSFRRSLPAFAVALLYTTCQSESRGRWIGFNAIARSTLPEVGGRAAARSDHRGRTAAGRQAERARAQRAARACRARRCARPSACWRPTGLLVQLPNRGRPGRGAVARGRAPRLRGHGLAGRAGGRACRGPRHGRRPRRFAGRCRASWRRRHKPGATCRPTTGSTALIHDRLNAIAGNAGARAQTYRTLNASAACPRVSLQPQSAPSGIGPSAEHRSMIEALAARDGAALRDLLVGHLRAKLQAVLDTMDEQRRQEPSGGQEQ